MGVKTMKNITLIGISFLIIAATNAYAQMNPDLLDLLNKVRIIEETSLKQCEFHSQRFGLKIPYHRILREKQETINTLTYIITNINGEVTEKSIKIQKKELASSALNNDAYIQIRIIQLYDDILARFGHPDVKQVVIVARNRAQQHFMLFTNRAQKLIDENKLTDRLSVQ